MLYCILRHFYSDEILFSCILICNGKMKNGLLVCAPSSQYKNIGDYVQSVAQEQFLHKVDCYVEREALNTFHSDEKTNLIMNGWFMWHPETFPPSDDINPLFVSFHLVPSVATAVLTPKGIEYLKRYQPIGARDLSTEQILKDHGIDSYFSGCLTLTLGNAFRKHQSGGVIFVDPYYPIAGMRLTAKNPFGYIRSLWYLIKNLRKALMLNDRFAVESRTVYRFISPAFERLYSAANFYEYYKHSFSDDVLMNAEYITHNYKVSDYKNNDEWMEAARKLVQKYANASLVVTSRIHCGLPCLGVETPCIFVTSEMLTGNSFRSSGRFGGLQELFHVAKWTKDGLEGVTDEMKDILDNGKIKTDTKVSVRTEYRAIRDRLNKTVTDFINRNK